MKVSLNPSRRWLGFPRRFLSHNTHSNGAISSLADGRILHRPVEINLWSPKTWEGKDMKLESFFSPSFSSTSLRWLHRKPTSPPCTSVSQRSCRVADRFSPHCDIDGAADCLAAIAEGLRRGSALELCLPSCRAWLISANGARLLAAVGQSGGWLLLWWMELLVWQIRFLIQPFSSIWFRPDSMFNGLVLPLKLIDVVAVPALGGGAALGTELLGQDCAAPRLDGPFGLAYSFWDWDEVFGPYLGPHEEWAGLLRLGLI